MAEKDKRHSQELAARDATIKEKDNKIDSLEK